MQPASLQRQKSKAKIYKSAVDFRAGFFMATHSAYSRTQTYSHRMAGGEDLWRAQSAGAQNDGAYRVSDVASDSLSIGGFQPATFDAENLPHVNSKRTKRTLSIT